jgi:hypothetical protein
METSSCKEIGSRDAAALGTTGDPAVTQSSHWQWQAQAAGHQEPCRHKATARKTNLFDLHARTLFPARKHATEAATRGEEAPGVGPRVELLTGPSPAAFAGNGLVPRL